jgi:HD-GYP domain-containing protein (c-di-GMP phosphodiesterase class II)
MIHASIGANILKPIVDDNLIRIIQHHHDHYDGSGWQQTILGKDIPLGARILAVSDAFDAMISNRSYRTAKSIDEAKAELLKYSSTQFDPEITAVFLQTTLTKYRFIIMKL